MGAPLPERTLTAVEARLRAGDPRAHIAADLGISRNTVDRIATSSGLGRRTRPHRSTPKIERVGDLQWQDDAACREWPVVDGKGFTEMHVAEQRTVCSGCPVQLPCLEFSLPGPIWAPNEAGKGHVFAGVTPKELVRLQRARQGSS
jgi:hypothetical protein